MIIRTHNLHSKQKDLIEIKSCIFKIILALNLNFSEMVQESKNILNSFEDTEERGREKLKQIDLVFRLYTPIYALLKQLNMDFDLQD